MVNWAWRAGTMTCSVYVPWSMKMHWAVVDEVDNALTADCTLVYDPPDFATHRHPDGGLVRLAANTVVTIQTRLKIVFMAKYVDGNVNINISGCIEV
jgi:hypothetical protein